MLVNYYSAKISNLPSINFGGNLVELAFDGQDAAEVAKRIKRYVDQLGELIDPVNWGIRWSVDALQRYDDGVCTVVDNPRIKFGRAENLAQWLNEGCHPFDYKIVDTNGNIIHQ